MKIKNQPNRDYVILKPQIEELIEKNYSLTKISKELNIPDSTLSYALKRLGLTPKFKGSTIYKDHNYFDIIDTEKKAYILGFVIADGCIYIEPKKKNGEIYAYSKRLMFTNSIDDLEVLEQIKNEIAPDSLINKIHNTKGAINRKEQCILRINSIPICNMLIDKYNIVPVKTQDIEFEFPFDTIPKELIRHFLRGMFDGDGTFSSGNISLVATSEKFLIQIGEIIKKQFQSDYSIQPKQSKNMIYYNLYILTHLGKNIMDLSVKEKKWYRRRFLADIYDYFYRDATIFLNRKEKTLKENIKERVAEANKYLTLQDILEGEFYCEECM